MGMRLGKLMQRDNPGLGIPREPLNKNILFICTEREEYPRNLQVLTALSKCFNVIKITSNKSTYPLRIIEVIIRFLWVSIFKHYHFIYAGFLGQPLVPVIKFFKEKPVILDAFVSVYDVLCLDRKDFKPSSLVAKISFWLDRYSFNLAEKIVVDTNANADFFSGIFDIRRNKFFTLYAGIDENIFFPREVKKNDTRFTVFFHGTFWHLHGIEYIVKAAKILKDEEDMLFRFVGGGIEKKKIVELAKKLAIKNIEFLDWVSYEELSNQIAGADVCLGGHFSSTDKAKRVISGKTFMYLGMKKPVIVGDNPATRELFIHGQNIYMCKMADEQSLAEAILELKESKYLREKIAEAGFEVFNNRCRNKKTQEVLSAIIGIRQA